MSNILSQILNIYRNSMWARKHESTQRIHPGFKTQGRCHQKSKAGVLMAQLF